ncbi:MAG: selenocysteine-specific translation elongation factor, partial [Planctomycetota bacterium]
MVGNPTLVIGTAGHIDHGKSRLVKALTGTDPDRLPEEQARGMTIDLGFAHLEADGCVLSFVDVPGHERFIRNMVAGATGVDVALLVVAADDSVMPQTREHAEVLSLLEVQRCVLVLTKMDLVDTEWADAVEEESRGLLETVGIRPLACVRTSAATGSGLAELRAVLVRIARQAGAARLYRWFRLPIDRTFTVPGRGTVATGSVAHGSVRRDEELELWPAGRRVRVRDIQTHKDEREATTGRTRLGVNLAGVPLDEVARGCELASPGYLHPTTRMDVWLAWLRMPGKVLRQTLRLRLHIATTETLAELRLADRPEADLVRGAYGQLRTAEPILAAWGQSFILRDEAATRTLGGGRVLRPFARLWTARRPPHLGGLQVLRESSPRERLAEVVRDAGWNCPPDPLLATAAGLADAAEVERLARSLIDRGVLRELETGGQRLLVHSDQLGALGEDLNRRLAAYLAENPRLPGAARSEWPGWMPRSCPERWRMPLAEWFVAGGVVTAAGEHIVPRGHGGALASADQALYDALVQEFAGAGLQSPEPAALHCRTNKNARRVDELIELAVVRGDLVRVAEGFWLQRRVWEETVARVAAALAGGRGLTVSEIRV